MVWHQEKAILFLIVNFFTGQIRIKTLFVKKIDIHISQRVHNSNTHHLSITFKLKVSMGETYPFSCNQTLLSQVEICF